MNIKPFVFPALALVSAFSLTAQAAPAMEADQVTASFERLLNHKPADIAVAVPAKSKAGADPLFATVNAVLWEQPSYHLFDKYASLSKQPKSKN